ncbi:hypothetical protein [Enterococcus termitis]|uniref:Lipoprotein n=1 Tax=Enterococcus termitis TaxID=332950 RepID=A0A1E5G6T0_9ENTE|nr:hypothetical protein [Enterococcus termitis]OEG08402.1 hypothetical protein BCR25_13390 [Enterococcus termitis]OJG98022.1 hypothetical protein RV18_GL003718 [Enterococcus termitis]
MKKKKMGQAALIIALGLVLSACGTSANMSKSSKESTKTEQTSSSKEPVKASESDVKESEKKTIETENGTFSVVLPEGWEEIEPTELNDEADLALENDKKIMYVAVLSESADDYDGFDSFKSIIDFHEWLEVEDETEKEIDQSGWKGTRYMITAKIDGMKAYYVYDIVQSDAGHYAQKMAWTMNSKKAKNGKELETILDSIQDVSK